MDVPIIKCETEVVEHPDGRRDVIVRVPMLQMAQAIKAHKEKLERLRREAAADSAQT